MLETVDWIELLWAAFAGYGLWLALRATRDASEDLKFLDKEGWNGRRRIMAKGHLKRETLRAVVQILFLLIGVLAMLSAPSPHPRNYVTVLMFFLVQVVVIYNTHNDRETAEAAVEYWKQTDLRHVAERDKQIEVESAFHTAVKDALERIEDAGREAATATRKVAQELAQSQGRADAIEGAPGEAADAASKSEKED